jgi:stress-induced-phosphoprotein 1
MSTAAEFKAQGNAFLQKKEFDNAIAAYTKAIELDSSDHVFFSNRSAAYLSKGDGVNALADGEKCIEISPQWAKGYTRKGAALHALKRYPDAVNAYEAGLKIAPNDAGLTSGLSEVKKAMEQPKSSGLVSPALLNKLAAHPKFGPKLADPAFQAKLNMLNTNPQAMLQDPEIMEIFGVLMGGDQEAPTPPSSQPAPTTQKAPVVQEEEEEEEEVEDLSPEEEKKKQNKKLAVAAKEKGNALYKQKNFEEALAAYDEAISLDPTAVLFHSNKAAVYIEMGEPDRAIEICEAAVEQGRAQRAPYQDIAKLFQRMAAAQLKKDDFPAAKELYAKAQTEHFDKAIERKVKNMELEYVKKQRLAYINPELALEAKERGNTAFREAKYGEAIKEYEEAVKRDPNSAPLRNNLAAALLKVTDFNGAKNQVEKSLELDDKYVKAWAKKGDIEFFMKEYHKALDSYKTGLKLEPDNKLCKDGLAKTTTQIQMSQYNESDEQKAQRQQHAMADPEIQMILQDPMVRQVLQDAQENPAALQRAMADVNMRAKIDKLVAAGVLSFK